MERARPEAAGFDAKALCSVLREVAAGTDNIHALVVERRGELVAELYRSGSDRPLSVRYGFNNPFGAPAHFDADTLHDTRSVSKSVVSLLYGIALAKGRAPAVDTPVLAIPAGACRLRRPARSRNDWPASFDEQRTRLGRDGPGPHDQRRDPAVLEIRPGPLRARAAVGGPARNEFNYNGGGTTVLANALVRRSGKPLAELAREDLFAPLGIAQFEWTEDIHGRALPFAGLRLRPRDMLKLGRLVNARGMWRGRQVVPADWIAESLRPRSRPE